jgi:two-component sensor histidine kinase
MLSMTRSLILGYGIAVAAVGIAVLAMRLLETPNAHSILMLLLAAVVFAAWMGGFGPGLVATVLSALAFTFLWAPPTYLLLVSSWDDALVLVVFLLLSVFVATLEATRRRTAQEREQMLAQLQTSLQEKDTLLREIHHRVKNNLQVISSLLALQAEAVHDPQVAALMQVSQERIHTMAIIHEHLYRADNLAQVNLASYLDTLAMHVVQAYCREERGVTLHSSFEDVWLDLDRAIPCGLILNELLTNCCKHAFPGGQSGEIHLELRTTPAHDITLSVRDTGVGPPEGFDVQTTESLGWQLVQLLTEQLRGTITLTHSGGTAISINFPATREETRSIPEPPPRVPLSPHG